MFDPKKLINKYSIGNGNRQSSFWLDDNWDTTSVFDDVEDKPKKKGKDLVALAGYKRAIGNFVRIVTQQNIPVKYSNKDDSYTDGKTVTLSGSISSKNFDSHVGLALHEGSHIIKSDFNYLKDALHSIDTWDVREKVKNLCNYVEDRRIDWFMYTTAPGYKGYYDALYDKYFNSKIIDKALRENVWNEPSWENYMNHIINFTNPNRNLDCLPGLRKIYRMIGFSKISRLKSTEDAFKLAREIYEVIDSLVPKVPDSQDGQSDDNGEGQSQEQDSQDSGDGDGTEVDTGDAQMTPQENDSPLTPAQQKSLEKAIQKQQDFNNGDVRKTNLSKRDSKALNTVDEAKVDIHEGIGKELPKKWSWNDDGTPNKGTRVVVMNNFTRQAVSDGLVPCARDWSYHCEQSQEIVNAGLRLGTILGRKLKVRNEDSSLKTTRLDSGRIDRRLISELGFNNDKVFSNTFVEKFSDAFVHVSIDASGSMGGRKWDNTLKSTVALVKAFSMIDGIDCVVTFRSTTNDRVYQEHMPFVLVAYDSRKDSIKKIQTLWQTLTPGGTTPEGLCFETLMKSIIKDSKGKESYFINYSDGMPMFSGKDVDYYNDEAINHTRKQVKTMMNNGIKVLSYFISDGYDDSRTTRDFNNMYGSDAQMVDVTSVVPLARSINKRFVTK